MYLYDDDDEEDEDEEDEDEDEEDGEDEEEDEDEEGGEGGEEGESGEEGGEDEEEGEGEGEGEAQGEGEGKGEGKGDGKKKKKKLKKPDPDPEEMKALAKSMGIVPKILPKTCPACHKHSLFADKPLPTGLRIAKFVGLACVGAVNVNDALQTMRFLCLNKKCKEFYKKTGTKFGIQPATMKLEAHHNYFYISL